MEPRLRAIGRSVPTLAALVFGIGCGSAVETTPEVLSALVITPNPSGYAPLTAEASFTTSHPVRMELFVSGPAAGDTLRHRFPAVTGPTRLPILGLFPDAANRVTLRFFDAADVLVGDTTRILSTPALPPDLPAITIDMSTPAAMKPGMNLVSYFGHASQLTPQRPFMFDAHGTIRWYLDFTNHPTLGDLFYDVGVERLANGHLYFGDGSTARVVEMDMLGRIVRTWAMPGYDFHHQVLEKPNGNFVVTVNEAGAATVEDHLIEIDRATGDIVRVWDLNQALDNMRGAWTTGFTDWFHANGVAYDPSDDALIVSGRTQGTVKLTNANEVVWILAPHREWDTAGDGTDLATRLLQPLDATGQPITDAAVLDGTAGHSDFEWTWYQHAPELMPDGTLLLFDNGDNRHYTGQDVYSRAVAYRIDAAAMTVQQVWQYGKELGAETYSRIVSDVDYHPVEETVVFMPGAIGGATPHGKAVEVDWGTRAVVFEATITPPTAPFGITFHRVERLSLYPPD